MLKKQISPKCKVILIISVIMLMLLAGVGLMIYPIAASIYMESVRSEIQTEYEQQIITSDSHDLERVRENAEKYNALLANGQINILDPEKNGYYEQLVIPEQTSVMGYVHIPRIQVDLPIYHGIDSKVLSAGCGHLPQSSLPIGGKSTHSVLSAHTGMASSKMFSDLPLLRPGDSFILEVLGEKLTYQIQGPEDIRTVLPVEVRAVQIQNEKDLCTLVTCTPIGVNTHRLLVTGHRIPNTEVQETVNIEQLPQPEDTESVWKEQYLKSIAVGLCLILALTVSMLSGFTYYQYLNQNKKTKCRKEPKYVKQHNNHWIPEKKVFHSEK